MSDKNVSIPVPAWLPYWMQHFLRRLSCTLHRRHRLPLEFPPLSLGPGSSMSCGICGRQLVKCEVFRIKSPAIAELAMMQGSADDPERVRSHE